MKQRVKSVSKKLRKRVIVGVNVWRIPEKQGHPPMKEFVIPEKLAPLVKAFSADGQAARLLIIEAAKTICDAQKSSAYIYNNDDKKITPDELEGIVALMQGIAPRDTLEMIYGAQIVSSHLMGLRLLSHNHAADQAIGLKLLRFSNEAMTNLQKKRAGGISQNINITYNMPDQGRRLCKQ